MLELYVTGAWPTNHFRVQAQSSGVLGQATGGVGPWKLSWLVCLDGAAQVNGSADAVTHFGNSFHSLPSSRRPAAFLPTRRMLMESAPSPTMISVLPLQVTFSSCLPSGVP